MHLVVLLKTEIHRTNLSAQTHYSQAKMQWWFILGLQEKVFMLKIEILESSPTSIIFQYKKGTVILFSFLKLFGLSEKNQITFDGTGCLLAETCLCSSEMACNSFAWVTGF